MTWPPGDENSDVRSVRGRSPGAAVMPSVSRATCVTSAELDRLLAAQQPGFGPGPAADAGRQIGARGDDHDRGRGGGLHAPGPSAAASALTRRRMTNAFSGSTSTRTPRDTSAPSTIGPIAATRTRSRPARSVASNPASVATCHRRSTCEALVNAIASTRASAERADQHLDRGLVAGRRVDVRRDRRHAGRRRPARKSTSGRFGSSP